MYNNYRTRYAGCLPNLPKPYLKQGNQCQKATKKPQINGERNNVVFHRRIIKKLVGIGGEAELKILRTVIKNFHVPISPDFMCFLESKNSPVYF